MHIILVLFSRLVYGMVNRVALLVFVRISCWVGYALFGQGAPENILYTRTADSVRLGELFRAADFMSPYLMWVGPNVTRHYYHSLRLVRVADEFPYFRLRCLYRRVQCTR